MARPAQSLPYTSLAIVLVVVLSTSLAQISPESVAELASVSAGRRNTIRRDDVRKADSAKATRDKHSIVNLRRVNERLYCGGLPETAADFQHLADLGIKSIVSVDGLRPKSVLAARYGLRYVHLPFGYDG
ncbi:MAG: hypothetical protein AAF497_27450, partial [Planctomycetota bacterium]